jgi:hypothetical protein
VAQPTNLSQLGFEAQTKKPSWWFWGPNHQTGAASFEAKPGETVVTSFETKLEKTVATGFEAKPAKTVAGGFEAKPLETVRVVLRSNHSQTIDLGCEAQPRNLHS